MEDEEKFFDRVTPKIQIKTMATNGMPAQGWIEIKGEDMLDRKCILITDIGKATINHMVGMPQQKVLSLLNSNLLRNAKLGQWTAKDDTCKIENNKGYSFAGKDAEDKLHERNAILHKKSYSDDSTLIIHNSNRLTIKARIIQNYGAHNTPCQREERRQ